MTCTFDKEKLTAYYDGELNAGEKAQVEAHISACSECLRELGEIKTTSVLVKTLSRPRAPQAVAAGVAREIAAAGRRTRFDKARRGALWVTAAAAGLFVVANILWFGAPERAPQPASSAENGLAAKKAFTGDEMAKADRDGRSGAAEPRAAAPPEPGTETGKARQEAREAEMNRKGAPAPVEKQAGEALARLQQSEQRAAAKDKAAAAEQAAAPRPAEVPEKPAGLKSEALADAKAPTSAAKPAAPGAPPPAAAAPAEGADRVDARRLKENSPPTAYVCESADRPLTFARATVEDYHLRRSGAPERKAAVASGGATRGAGQFGQAAPPPPLTLDLTDAEIAELSKELEKQGLKLVPASTEQEKAFNAQPVPGRLGGAGAPPEQDQLRKAPEEAPAAAPAPDAARRRANTRRITIYFSAPPPAAPANKK